MNSTLVQEIVASVCVSLVFALLAKVFPANVSATSTLSLKELGQKYLNWNLVLGVSFMALTAAFAFVVWILLRDLAAFHTSILPAAEVTYTPESTYWVIPAVVLGTLCDGCIVSLFAERLMRAP